MPKHTEQEAVCFAPEDYAGPGVRWAIIAVDICILLLLYVFLLIAGLLLEPSTSISGVAIFGATYSLMWVFYLGVVHSVGLGSVGYRVMGYKLVDYFGRRPTLWRAIVRSGALLLSPSHILIDYVFVLCPRTRQTFWDLTAETVVVRQHAEPQSTARLCSKLVFFVGQTYVWREPDSME